MAPELIELIEKKYTADADFSKVLTDVAQGLKNKGFFEEANWKDIVIQTFGRIVDDNLHDISSDNEHEISNSFVDERSNFNTKSKSSIDNTIDSKSTSIKDMFENSNDSFEIPETQALPPTDHLNDDDDLDSEGFITMPVETFDANDCSQSQAILRADELGRRSPNDFHDSDSTDLEISKLEWDDSANDTAKNKSTSVVTPTLNLVAKPATAEYDRSASVTPDLEFEALASPLTKSIMGTLASPKLFKTPSHLAGIEKKNDSTPICDNELDRSSACPTSNVTCQEEIIPPDKKSYNVDGDDETQLDDDINKGNENVESARPKGTDEHFGRPKDPIKETSFEDDMTETQLFTKSNEPTTETFEPNRVVDNPTNDAIGHFDTTQVFTKSSADISNCIDDRYNSFTKNNAAQSLISSSMEHDDDDYVAEKKNDDRHGGNSSEVQNKIETEEPTVPRKLRKRNRLIESSDDEEEDENPVNNKSDDESNDESISGNPIENSINVDESNDENYIYDAATQKFETLKPVSPQQKLISEMKRNDWSQLCEKADSQQSTIVFKSVFDQCKDLAIVQTSNVSVASVNKRKIVVDAPISQPPQIRQSSRTKTRKNYTSDVGEAIPSKRQRVRTSPIVFKAPADSSISTKTTDVLSLKKRKPATTQSTSSSSCVSESDEAESTNSSSSVSKSDEVDENVDIENLATQVFMKASSTPKELAKPLAVLTRRQARVVTAGLPNPKAVKELIPKLRNQSVTYSPKTTGVKVKVESTDAGSSRSRKRKAATDVLSVSTDSNDSGISRTSSSMTRSGRNPNFRVMFTMVDPDPHKSLLKELNITIAKADDYNALITDKIYRTCKFMCALAAGRPIVSTKWLDELKTKKSMIDPFEFLLKDRVGEKKYKFNLAKTLNEVRKNGNLFRNHSILVTPNCSPDPDVLKDVIASAGGKYLKTSLVPRKGDTVMCIADQKAIVPVEREISRLDGDEC